jgi:hypothetical protein
MTDIADQIALLFELGYRNTIVMTMSLVSKEMLQVINDLAYPWQNYTTSAFTMYSLCIELEENYDKSIDIDIEEGRYKELNHENVFVWHEYSQGEFIEVGRIGAKTMMNHMLQL